MREVVFSSENGWLPKVVRGDAGLRLAIIGGAGPLHDPREFDIALTTEQADAIRDDLPRFLILYSTLMPLCDAAGIAGTIDEDAAVALLNPILLGTPDEAIVALSGVHWRKDLLVAHGADIALLERGDVLAAMERGTAAANHERAQEYRANKGRQRRGVRLSELDTAVLKYTGQYLTGANIPVRKPGSVPSRFRSQVLEVIGTAEDASAGMRIRRQPFGGSTSTRRKDWDAMTAAVEKALGGAYPELAGDVVRSVAFLMCSEAADRERGR